jgi:hypothetical protein
VAVIAGVGVAVAVSVGGGEVVGEAVGDGMDVGVAVADRAVGSPESDVTVGDGMVGTPWRWPQPASATDERAARRRTWRRFTFGPDTGGK